MKSLGKLHVSAISLAYREGSGVPTDAHNENGKTCDNYIELDDDDDDDDMYSPNLGQTPPTDGTRENYPFEQNLCSVH